MQERRSLTRNLKSFQIAMRMCVAFIRLLMNAHIIEKQKHNKNSKHSEKNDINSDCYLLFSQKSISAIAFFHEKYLEK